MEEQIAQLIEKYERILAHGKKCEADLHKKPSSKVNIMIQASLNVAWSEILKDLSLLTEKKLHDFKK